MILRGTTCLTLDPHRRVLSADIRIDPSGNIDSFLPPGRTGFPGEEEISLPGRIVMPGLIQTHVHLCQTLMRGLAEQLPLADWLRERIWPLEAAHDAGSLRASARLGILELLTGGTTAILDMGTTRHLEVILRCCSEMGIRAISGTAIMDEGEGVPEPLQRDLDEALDETRQLMQRYSLAKGGRVGVCLAPRFIPSVSDRAWREIASLAEGAELLIHTHACETRDEVEMTVEKTGSTPFAYLQQVGAAGARLRAAHGVWLDSAQERKILREAGAAILHCPGCNAKLGSGTADVASLWDDGVPVGIGTDGAACNNRLDCFEELRRAAGAIATMHGAASVDPIRVLDMATLTGAKLLGLDETIGSLEPGKSADLVVLNPAAGVGLWSAGDDLHAQVLHGAGRENVEQVWIAGQQIVSLGRLRRFPAARILREATAAAREIKRKVEEEWQSRSR